MSERTDSRYTSADMRHGVAPKQLGQLSPERDAGVVEVHEEAQPRSSARSRASTSSGRGPGAPSVQTTATRPCEPVGDGVQDPRAGHDENAGPGVRDRDPGGRGAPQVTSRQSDRHGPPPRHAATGRPAPPPPGRRRPPGMSSRRGRRGRRSGPRAVAGPRRPPGATAPADAASPRSTRAATADPSSSACSSPATSAASSCRTRHGLCRRGDLCGQRAPGSPARRRPRSRSGRCRRRRARGGRSRARWRSRAARPARGARPSQSCPAPDRRGPASHAVPRRPVTGRNRSAASASGMPVDRLDGALELGEVDACGGADGGNAEQARQRAPAGLVEAPDVDRRSACAGPTRSARRGPQPRPASARGRRGPAPARRRRAARPPRRGRGLLRFLGLGRLRPRAARPRPSAVPRARAPRPRAARPRPSAVPRARARASTSGSAGAFCRFLGLGARHERLGRRPSRFLRLRRCRRLLGFLRARRRGSRASRRRARGAGSGSRGRLQQGSGRGHRRAAPAAPWQGWPDRFLLVRPGRADGRRTPGRPRCGAVPRRSGSGSRRFAYLERRARTRLTGSRDGHRAERVVRTGSGVVLHAVARRLGLAGRSPCAAGGANGRATAGPTRDSSTLREGAAQAAHRSGVRARLRLLGRSANGSSVGRRPDRDRVGIAIGLHRQLAGLASGSRSSGGGSYSQASDSGSSGRGRPAPESRVLVSSTG